MASELASQLFALRGGGGGEYKPREREADAGQCLSSRAPGTGTTVGSWEPFPEGRGAVTLL